MMGVLLQDLTTLVASAGSTTVLQAESGWVDLSGFKDVVAFLDIREIVLGGATNVTLTYQTAPTKDSALFVDMTTAVTAATGVTVTKMLQASATNPLSRWGRFQLGRTGTPSSAWGLTFRVWLAANASVGSRPALSPAMRERMVPATPSMPLAGRVPMGVRGLPPGVTLPASGRNPFTG